LYAQDSGFKNTKLWLGQKNKNKKQKTKKKKQQQQQQPKKKKKKKKTQQAVIKEKQTLLFSILSLAPIRQPKPRNKGQ